MKHALALLLLLSFACVARPDDQPEDRSNDEVQGGARLFAHLPRWSRVTVEGTLESLRFDDFDHDTHEHAYFVLEAQTGRRIELLVGSHQHRADLVSGATVRATGRTLDDAIATETDADVEVLAAAVPTLLAGATTMRRALVMRVNFTDATVACTQDDVTNLMYTGAQNLNGWYQEASHGALGFEPDTNGDGAPDVISVSVAMQATQVCDFQGWAQAADAAATASGVNLALYQHFQYVLPAAARCYWAGLAYVGCSTGACRSWIRTCTLADAYAHELGHNLGFGHASTDANNDGTIDSEYGDRSDFMGQSGVGFRNLNAPHTTQLGWLPASKIATLASGSWRIAPLEADSSQTADPQVLKIAKTDSTGESYYLSYRRALGNYSTSLSSAYTDRISLHRAAAYANTSLITTLGDGDSWSDPANGLTITVTGHDSAAASADVTVSCVVHAPVVTFGSPTVGRAGTSVVQRATVENRDGAACAAGSTFALAANAPAGWGIASSLTSVTLAPGQSASVDLTITPPAGSPDGTYAIALSATDLADAAHAGSGSGSHLLDSTPPSAVTTLGGTASGLTATLSWSVPSDGSGSGVSRYWVYRNGVRWTYTYSTTFVDTVTRAATISYMVTAEDVLGNVSGPGNVVTLALKKGGGRR